MAGDWIKVERATLNKPEVLEMAEELGLDRHAVIGKLVEVWFWFDEQTENGNAISVSDVTLMKRIDVLTCVPGFAKAMQWVGWLRGSTIPNFDRHNGESAKKRALTAKRVKRFRNAEVTHKSLPEKRREEKRLNPTGENGGNAPTSVSDSRTNAGKSRQIAANGHEFDLPTWVPREAWDGYCEMRVKIRKPMTDRAKALALGKLEGLKAKGYDPQAVLDEATEKSWQGIYEPKAGVPASGGAMPGMEGVV